MTTLWASHGNGRNSTVSKVSGSSSGLLSGSAANAEPPIVDVSFLTVSNCAWNRCGLSRSRLNRVPTWTSATTPAAPSKPSASSLRTLSRETVHALRGSNSAAAHRRDQSDSDVRADDGGEGYAGEER